MQTAGVHIRQRDRQRQARLQDFGLIVERAGQNQSQMVNAAEQVIQVFGDMTGQRRGSGDGQRFRRNTGRVGRLRVEFDHQQAGVMAEFIGQDRGLGHDGSLERRIRSTGADDE